MSTSTKSVMITGASSGIGRATALQLAARGYRVFAGVRKPEDGQALQAAAQGKIEPVVIDVVDYESVSSAARLVATMLGADGLDALVNNAGISISGPLELLPMAMFDRQMQVNVSGQVAVTQAFLPLLRKARGRIVFIGSMAGRVTMPLLGAYSASKHAVEAVANAFRHELRSAGIKVSVLEPGSIKSEIWQKADAHHDELLAAVPRIRELYGAELGAMLSLPKQAARYAIPAERIARLVHRVLSTARPRARYLVGPDAHVMAPFFEWLPTWFTDFVVARSMRVLAARG
jgi:NAD(P)-dependent dehydrogenase (short-subunit alcohol dehydrogenase family)